MRYRSPDQQEQRLQETPEQRQPGREESKCTGSEDTREWEIPEESQQHRHRLRKKMNMPGEKKKSEQ